MGRLNLKKQILILGGDIILIIASLYLAPVIRFVIVLDPTYVFEPVDVVAVFIYLLSFYVFDFYNLEDIRSSRYILRFLIATAIASASISSIYYIFHVRPGSLILFISSLLICLSLLGWRYLFDVFFKYSERPRRLLIVGAGETGGNLYEMLKANKDYEILGFLDDDEKKWGISFGNASVIGGTGLLSTLVKELKIDNVIIAITRVIRPEIYKKLVEAKFNGIAVHEMPSFYEKVAGRIPVLHTNEMWLGYADIYGVKSNLYNAKVKKIIDKTFAILVLLFAVPIMCIVSLLVKVDTRGPVLYRQKRVGFNGVIFNLIKFRSMNVDAEMNGAVWAEENDPRITRVGRIMRFLRIDELPQLWNVFKGELSLVGPRPERPEFVESLTLEIPYYSLRHSVKPGITGWAQVNYPYGASKEDALEKLQFDLYYIKNVTFLLDLYIVLRTMRTVLFRKGAR
ncbi:MAG: TIGR03013 family XrtA/PEP-CTERM system glycosyltransferase [Syntrophales bacterium]